MITGFRRYKVETLKQPSITFAQPESIEEWANLVSSDSQIKIDETYQLRGVSVDWPSRELRAECKITPHILVSKYDGYTYFPPPEEMCEQHLLEGVCTCGIYVLKQPDVIPDYKNYPVLTSVTCWGAFIEFEHGYRVQYARIEHIWLEKDYWADDGSIEANYSIDRDRLIESLKSTYGVGVEIREGAVCCGRDHEISYWPSQNGPLLLCQMETSHIVNALRYLKSASHHLRSAYLWKQVFEKELEYRSPKLVDGKMKVRF